MPDIEPRPLHNQAGTTRALARQMLLDLDDSRLETPVQTATLRMLLETLCDLLTDKSKVAEAVTKGALSEPMRMLNPNLELWKRKAEEDEDRAAVAE